MAKIFRIELLPALHGDCIWLEYGESPDTRHVLIDGGPLGAFPALEARVRKLPEGARNIELLVVTHVDADHIEGAVKLLNQDQLGLQFRDIWFNGWDQLSWPLNPGGSAVVPAEAQRSPAQGEYLAVRLEGREEAWNRWFFGYAVMVPDDGPLPHITLNGGLELTLLSPNFAKLEKLQASWHRSIDALNAEPGDREFFRERLEKDKRYRGASDVPIAPDSVAQAVAAKVKLDAAVANGSSIAFVAEYAGRSCAFLADAHMPVIEAAVARLASERRVDRLPLDAVKVSHHGSSGNITASFLAAVECRNYLVSTDGSVFDHPDDAAIRCIVENVPQARLYFNYRSPRNAQWADESGRREPRYTAHYPASGENGISVDLLADEALSAHDEHG